MVADPHLTNIASHTQVIKEHTPPQTRTNANGRPN